MKAKDKTTGTFKEVYVKALDSLPVGSEIDFEGTDIPVGWEETTDVNSYSTDEIKTNKTWIDGKPIYRKTFVKENATTGNNEISLSDLDYDYIVIKESSFIRGDFTFSPNRYKASLADDVVEALINNNSKNLIVNVGSFWNNINCYVTLEYTKTTD